MGLYKTLLKQKNSNEISALIESNSKCITLSKTSAGSVLSAGAKKTPNPRKSLRYCDLV
jgi:hypothetical protein